MLGAREHAREAKGPEEFKGAGLFLLSRGSSFIVSWFLFLAFWGVADGIDWREPSY